MFSSAFNDILFTLVPARPNSVIKADCPENLFSVRNWRIGSIIISPGLIWERKLIYRHR